VNRLEACKKFIEEHPGFHYGHAHVVIEDKNIDDYWIYRGIKSLASTLAQLNFDFGESEEEAITALKFLISLIDLPLPDGWDDDDEP
jgi:hypothetical protein